jgi:hypothetical protein
MYCLLDFYKLVKVLLGVRGGCLYAVDMSELAIAEVMVALVHLVNKFDQLPVDHRQH